MCDMELNNKVTVLSRQMKEITTTLSGLQSLVVNSSDAIHREIADLKGEQKRVQQKLDKLVNINDTETPIDKDDKKQLGERIYNLHNDKNLSWSTIAGLLGLSKSTVIRRYKEYIDNMEVDF